MNKGQSLLVVVMWAGGLSLSAAIGSLTYMSGIIGKVDSKIDTATVVNAQQEVSIALLKSSACVINQNVQAIGKALKVNVVNDPNCK